MSSIPCIAVVIEGGLVQTTLIENWPDQLPLPRLVIVDHDTDGADETELTEFIIGGDVVKAFCHVEAPIVYESFKSSALSPCAIVSMLDDIDRKS